MSSATSYPHIVKQGLWSNNPALVQLLGLCPLLAVTNSLVNGLGLGLVTTLVMVATNLLVSLTRNHIKTAVRLPAFVMIIATLVTVAELVMQAFAYELYQILGIFIPLIVTNCAILGRAEAYASKQTPWPAALDGLFMGLGFSLVLVILGGLREVLGTGALFANMDLLLGSQASNWQITLWADYQGFLLAILPPGAFLMMGFLIAGKNAIDNSLRQGVKQTAHEGESRRVRVTGVIS